MLFVLTFLLFFGKILALNGPKIEIFGKSVSDYTVDEGDTVTFTCLGERKMGWRFPDRNAICFDEAELSKIENRLEFVSDNETWSNVTLMNVTFLDVGRVECFYFNASNSAMDSFYLFVNSSTNLMMPCLSTSRTCILPPDSVYYTLEGLNDFVPCRLTSKSVQNGSNLEVKLKDGHPYQDLKVDPIFDDRKGFQLVDIGRYNHNRFEVVCRPKNRSSVKFCKYELIYLPMSYKKCGVKIKKQFVSSPYNSPHGQVFNGSNWNLTCKAKCDVYLKKGNFEFNLIKNDQVLRNCEQDSEDAPSEETSCTFSLEKISSQRDGGRYRCQLSFPKHNIAVNSTVDSAVDFSVSTPEEPVFLNPVDSDPIVIYIDSGNSTNNVSMDCLAKGNPEPETLWYYKSLENLLESETDGVLKKTHAPTGTFICVVNNSFGRVLTRTFRIVEREAFLKDWVIALISGIVFGLVLAVILLGFVIFYHLRRKNRRVMVQSLLKQLFSDQAEFRPLPERFSTFTVATPHSLAHNLFNITTTAGSCSTNITVIDQIVTQNSKRESGIELVSIGDVIEQLPCPGNVFEIDEKRLDFGVELGRGAFGIVRKADLKMFDPDHLIPVAVKGIRDSLRASQYKALLSEIKLLASLGYHMNIVNMIGVVSKKLKTNGELYMVLEYCEGGSLSRFFESHRSVFSETDDFDYFTLRRASSISTPVDNDGYLDPTSPVLLSPISMNNSLTWNVAYYNRNNDSFTSPLLQSSKSVTSGASIPSPVFGEGLREKLSRRDLVIFAYQIANGMEFLHDRHCFHRDLAARNILVCSGNLVKISDFGLAKTVSDYDAIYKPQTKGGKLPWKWMPPECLEFQGYTKKADIWAFGVLLWEIFTLGRDPYRPEFVRYDEIFLEQLKSGEIRLPQPDSLKADEATWMWNLINSCWRLKLESRPNFRTLKEEIRDKLPSEALIYYDSFNNVASPVLPSIVEETPPSLPPRNRDHRV